MEKFFSQDPIFQALANIGGVIGLCIIAYKLLSFIRTFLLSWYHSSLRAMISEIRRHNIIRSFRCASDEIMLISFIVLECCHIAIATIFLFLYNSFRSSKKSQNEFDSSFRIFQTPYQTYSDLYPIISGIILIMLLVLLIYLMVRISKLYIVVRNVYFLRYKYNRRSYFEIIRKAKEEK